MDSDLAEARASGGLERDARPLEIWAWAMYDFANSGYTTGVLTAIFNAYFVAVVAGNAPWATFAWTATLSLSHALVIVTAPAIGAYADLRTNKKRLLLFTTVGCILGIAAFVLAAPGNLVIAVVGAVLSNFYFPPAAIWWRPSCQNSRAAGPWARCRAGAGARAKSAACLRLVPLWGNREGTCPLIC